MNHTSSTEKHIPARLRSASLVMAAVFFVVVAFVIWTRLRASQRSQYNWHFIYVMAYDNDLDRCSAHITEALRRGAQQPGIAVSILSDSVSRDGLHRRVFAGEVSRETQIHSEDITDVTHITTLLDGAVREAPAKRYVLVFLDHGGMLDQMGFDERTQLHATSDPMQEKAWLSARAVGDAVRAWMRRSKLGEREVPLVFLQQCGRASIEALMNLRHTSEAVLASQRTLGACNTYYESLLAYASLHPNASASALAEVVFDADRNYQSYTLVRTRAIDAWPQHANALTTAIFARTPAPDATTLSSMSPCFSAGLETNYDLAQVVRAVSVSRGPVADQAAQALLHWLRDELVMAHRRRGTDMASVNWCGVSTHVPTFAPLIDFYPQQPAYRETHWGDLVRGLAPPMGITIRASPRRQNGEQRAQ
jgi:hypothetical protein